MYSFPPDTPQHVRALLSGSAYWMKRMARRYSLRELQEALDFAQAHPDFAASPLWNKTKAATLGRLIRKRQRTGEIEPSPVLRKEAI